MNQQDKYNQHRHLITMKRSASILTLLGIILGIALAMSGNSLFAKAPKADKKPEPPVHETIASVSGSTITVAGKKEQKTYTITSFTEITVNGQHSTAAGLKVGMDVTVGADSNGKASLINAQTPHEHKKK